MKNMKTKKIAPSLLSADFSCLEKEIKSLGKAPEIILHLDVMDGHFVPNITFGPLLVKAVKQITDIPLDVHLMIENPGDYIDVFCEAGADYISVHIESDPHIHRVLQKIKDRGVKAGIALNPHTPVSAVEDILHMVDFILIMSVNPGFGGQKFIPNTLEKLKRLQQMLSKRNFSHIEVEVDGGVKLQNIKDISKAGCDIFVSGSGVFRAKNYPQIIQKMLELVKV